MTIADLQAMIEPIQLSDAIPEEIGANRYPRCSRGSIPLNQGANDHTAGVYGWFELARRCFYRAVLESARGTNPGAVSMSTTYMRPNHQASAGLPKTGREAFALMCELPRSIGRIHKPLSAISCHGHCGRYRRLTPPECETPSRDLAGLSEEITETSNKRD